MGVGVEEAVTELSAAGEAVDIELVRPDTIRVRKLIKNGEDEEIVADGLV
jgi:hypothetical protein